VVADELIVTLPGFRYSVTYYKPHKSPQLMAKNIASEDDPRAPTADSELTPLSVWKSPPDADGVPCGVCPACGRGGFWLATFPQGP
jgi:hypothetical protein